MLGRAEVDQLDHLVVVAEAARDEEVAWRDVPVQEPDRVHGLDRGAALEEERAGASPGHRRQPGQRLPLDVLQHQRIELAAPKEVVHPDDVRVVYAEEQPPLLDRVGV